MSILLFITLSTQRLKEPRCKPEIICADTHYAGIHVNIIVRTYTQCPIFLPAMSLIHIIYPDGLVKATRHKLLASR